jgi:hypothetical protein
LKNTPTTLTLTFKVSSDFSGDCWASLEFEGVEFEL